MGQGPLSDPTLVEAFKHVVPAQINVKADSKGVAERYGISKPCNFVFAAVDGTKIETYEGEKEARPMAERIYAVVKANPRDLPWTESLDAAAKTGRHTAVFFVGKKAPQAEAMLDDSLEEVREKFAFVKVTYDRKDDAVKRFDVKKADTLVILDAEGAEVARFVGAKSPKALLKELGALFPEDE